MTTRYASGEEPRAGDIVRLVDPDYYLETVAKIGDVLVMGAVEYDGLVNTADHKLPSFYPRRFELIVRAGKPVRYQPGDVVECLSWDGTMFKPGRRYEIARVDFYSAHIDKGEYGSAGICTEDRRFKLVHRLAKSEPLVFTPPEPQVGDRVRVTFEATMRPTVGDEVYLLDIAPQCGQLTTFDAKEIEHGNVTVEIIERAEKPLAVGDRVRGSANRIGEIVAMTDEHAWLKVSPRSLFTERLDKLERVS